MLRSCKPLTQTPNCGTIQCQLSATAYSIYSQLPSISVGHLLNPQPIIQERNVLTMEAGGLLSYRCPTTPV